MRHPAFIIKLRALHADPQAWWVREAYRTYDMDPEMGAKQLARLKADRDRSMPSYAVVYLEVVIAAAAVIAIVGGGLRWLLS
jgi:hypothetical protein